MTLLKNYLSSNFYHVSGLQHMIPVEEDMDYTGTTMISNHKLATIL